MTQEERGPAPEFDGPALGRLLLRTTRAAALGSLDPGGFPVATLTTVATDIDGSPISLLSRLSAHRTNLERDPRASLLLARAGKGDPLAHPRLTVIGRLAPVEDPAEASRLRNRFLARHPKAKLYVDFADFAFFRMRVESGHLNGGFARAATLGAADLLVEGSDAAAFAAFHDGAVAHMNEDHRDAAALYATRLAGARPGEWRVAGLDPLGVDLACGDETARVEFAAPARDAAALRGALAALAREAREKGS